MPTLTLHKQQQQQIKFIVTQKWHMMDVLRLLLAVLDIPVNSYDAYHLAHGLAPLSNAGKKKVRQATGLV